MQNLGFENARYYYQTGTEKPYKGQSLATPSNYYGVNQPYVEITLDIHDDSVSVYGLESPDLTEDQGKSLLRPDRSSRSNSVLKRITSSVSNELKRVASSVSSSKPPLARFGRSKSRAEIALKGLKFITKTDGVTGWPGVAKKKVF